MRYIIGILVLGVTVLFHEYGHYLFAVKNGITVEEFSVGWGPRILKHTSKKTGTVYSLRILPFGGSCAMLNELEGEKVPGSFVGAALWRRVLVVAAGPVFNILLALICSFFVVGFAGADPARVADVQAGSPEAAAGLQDGDEILSFDGHTVANSREFYLNNMLYTTSTDTISVKVLRDGHTYRLEYHPETETRYMLGFYYDNAENGDGVLITMLRRDSALKKAGLQNSDVITAINGTRLSDTEDLQNYLKEHPLDGSPVDITYRRDGRTREAEDIIPEEETNAVTNFSYSAVRERQNAGGVIRYSFGEVGYWIRSVWKSLGGLLNGTFGINDMSGPVGIVKNVGDAYGEAARTSVLDGILTLLSLMSMISANLGVMNLIPLPALDGGRLLLMVIEAIRRKPVNRSIEANINFYGLLALLALIVYITIHDVLRLF